MRILAIRFQNLNSLRDSQELNLETGPLAEAGLFAITGPTGSGKSTILDAVTLALYARAARYGKATAEDMMSRGAMECSAAVDFLCESGRYTAKWMLGRTRKGNIKPAIHELSQYGTILAKGLRDVPVMVEALTGLDYDRFLRSVLLAQGQFAAFLRAGKDERADLLERITGSHIYSELGSLSYHISAGHARDIAQEGIRLGAVTLLPGEERMGISERLTTLGAELAESEEQRAVLTAKVTATKRGVELRRQTAEHAKAAEQHAAAVKDFAPEEARLAQHAATMPFADSVSALGERERTAQGAAAAGNNAARKADAARGAAAVAAGAALAALAVEEAATGEEQRGISGKQRKAAKELAAAVQWLEEHIADAALAEKLQELSAAVERVTALASHLVVAEKKCGIARAAAARTVNEAKESAAKSSAAKHLSDKAAGEAAAAKAALADFLKEPWTSSEQLEREVQRLANLTAALQRMTAVHSGLTEQRAKLAALAAEGEAFQSVAAKLSVEDEAARAKLEAAREKDLLLQKDLRQELLIRSMKDQLAHLEEGKPCPLCGAEDHPWADPSVRPASDGAEEQLKLHQKAQRALEREAKDAAAAAVDAGKSLAASQAQQRTMQQAFDNSQQSLEKEWRAHFPDTEGNGDLLAAIETETAGNHAMLSALAEKVRAAQERERGAGAVAERAAGEAKLCQALAEAAEKNTVTTADAVEEAEGLRGSASVDLAAREKELQAALLSAGEPDAGDAAAALQRLKAREREWRVAVETRARLEKQAVILQHDMEKCTLHAKTLADRRRETEEAIARAGLTVAHQPVPDGGWAAVNAAFAKAMTDSHAASSLADNARESAQKAAELAGALTRTLTVALAGSDFADIAALRAAQLDATALMALTRRRDELREALVRLETQKENLAREAAALQEEWQRIAGAVRLGSRSVPVASSTEAQQEERPGRSAVPGDSLPDFEEALSTLTTHLNSLRTERGALQQRLDTDNEARARHAAAVAELEKQKSAAAPWARLCELIGSADGDKFSRYAQSITLDHLTMLANARLAQLCDRYRILRCGAPGELALQISDAWQADTVRPMESLSGGETFLVSLALALGLSELAGRRTRIGTLFIDEGFGTLDSTALDIALSALEGLRAGHSSIGIISHVEALKARLTTQVEVVRGAGGWSRLEVRA